MFRGADGGVVLSDRAFAGSDTLATSYALSAAVRKIGNFDIIIGGRQAIDGDTAQVGPQIAEKLGIPPDHLRRGDHQCRQWRGCSEAAH